MWLNRNTKLMESFPPQKWDVNAYSMWSGYSVFRFTDSQSWYQAKEVWITHHHSRQQYSTCELLHMHSFLPETDWRNIHDLPNYLYKKIYLYKRILWRNEWTVYTDTWLQFQSLVWRWEWKFEMSILQGN